MEFDANENELAELAKARGLFVFSKNKRKTLCPVKGCRNPWNRHNKRGICSKCQMRTWREKYPIKAAFAHLKESAKRRRKEFDLTLDQFTAFCQSTGYHEHSGKTRECLQVDRIDHTRGYTLDNIQILTGTENSAKGWRERFGYAWKADYPQDPEQPF